MVNVGVFGRSDAAEGSIAYTEGVTAGRAIAERGYTVVCGGYGGIMEAVCRGAEEAGGKAIGVTCRAFNGRKPNHFITSEIKTDSLAERIKTLVDESDAFVVLEGKTGTLHEIIYYISLKKMGLCNKGPMVLVGKYWGGFKSLMMEKGWIEEEEMKDIFMAGNPFEAISIIERSQKIGTAYC